MTCNINCNLDHLMQNGEGLINGFASHASHASHLQNLCPNDVISYWDKTKYDLNRLHVVNIHQAVDRKKWIDAVEIEVAQRSMAIDLNHAGIVAWEDAFAVHHLMVVWKEVTNGE